MNLGSHFRIEKRDLVGARARLLSALLALLASLLVSALLVSIAGGSALQAMVSLFQGGFGDWGTFLETLVKATPILLTALAAIIAYRARLWNIGMEGQLFAGAMASYLAYTSLQGMWLPAHLVIIFLAGLLGGALWAAIAALLKSYFNVDEIITTVMLNYIATYLLSLLLSNVWREQGSIYRQTPQLPKEFHWLYLWPNSRLHLGFALAVLAAVLVWYILQKTALGYEIRSIGNNPLAARFKGINIHRIWLITMLISGALAGMAGVGELFGVQHRLRLDLSTGYGFIGIIVAMLSGLEPLVAVPVSIFFGGLLNGAILMQIITKVPTALIQAVEAIILIFLLASQVLVSYRIRKVQAHE
jgi:simple sugar transport system permease protein